MSKAAALRSLMELETAAFVIDPFVEFTLNEWRSNPTGILEMLRSAHLGPTVAVRSSANDEAIIQASPPGLFETVLDVDLAVSLDLVNAIELVFESFLRAPTPMSPTDQRVLVQAFISNVQMAGVITTLDANRVPYITVEYDDWSGRTDSVTKGHRARRVTIAPLCESIPERWQRLLEVLRMIRSGLARHDLVVEFAIDRAGRIHIFQAWDRGRKQALSPTVLHAGIASLEMQLSQLRQERKRLTLSDMSDWNPAEMLGNRPGPLDISLYRFLLTDRTCFEARRDLGYFFLAEDPLLVELGSHPYIDVERSLTSLTPQALTPTVRTSYIQACLTLLERRPQLHDKIEHEVVFTYLPYRGITALRERLKDLMSDEDIVSVWSALQKFTSDLVRQLPHIIDQCNRSIRTLREWRHDNPAPRSSLDDATIKNYIGQAMAVCRTHGASPFSAIARIAFIADGLVKESLAAGGTTDEDVRRFWSHVSTPADELQGDLKSISNMDELVGRYGHLRPQSYNIESLPYRLRPDFLDRLRKGRAPVLRPADDLPARLNQALATYCAVDLGLDSHDALTAELLCAAISMREWLKFWFTLVLDDVLELLARIAEDGGFSRSDVRTARLDEILEKGSGLVTLLRRGQSAPPETRFVYPDVLGVDTTFHWIESPDAEPTFVTDCVVEAPTEILTSEGSDPTLVDGKIVVIEAADPGYDWVFSRPILGLVTCYGGASSHMAIRCQELGVPAAIGCGAARFAQVGQFDEIHLDCAAGAITSGRSWWRGS